MELEFELPSQRPIRIHRDFYLAVTGEYEPCADSWSGAREMNSPYVETCLYAVSGCGTGLRSHATKTVIEARVWKHGLFAKKKSSSYSYSTQLRMGRFSMTLGKMGKAKSLRQIERIVNAMEIPEEIEEIQRKFYAQRTSICVYIDQDGKWEPFCTSFDLNDRGYQLPRGKYLEVTLDSRAPNGLNAWIMDVKYGGYAGNSKPGYVPERGWFPEDWYIKETTG